MSKEIKPGQVALVENALTACITMDRTSVIEHLPYIIIMFIFYFTVSHAQNLVEQDPGCKGYISRENYDPYISTLIYWIISFVF